MEVPAAVPLPLLVEGFVVIKLAAPSIPSSSSLSESESPATAFTTTAGVIPGPSTILEEILFLLLLEDKNSSVSHPLRAAATAREKPARAAAAAIETATAEELFDGVIIC